MWGAGRLGGCGRSAGCSGEAALMIIGGVDVDADAEMLGLGSYDEVCRMRYGRMPASCL